MSNYIDSKNTYKGVEYYHKGTWIMGCYQLNLKEVECRNCKTATEAAEYAVKVVRQKLYKMNEALSTCS